jgi:hypothetical protein
MRPRLLFYVLVLALVFLLARAAAAIPPIPPDTPTGDTPDPVPVPASTDVLVTQLEQENAKLRRRLHRARALLRRRWQPTVDYALRLASGVTGVSYWQLRSVAWCESRFDPFARNGKYLGIFQLGWTPFGFSPFDPVANALSAAVTVRHDGSWRQWECKP